MGSAVVDSSVDNDRVRLHITPFNAELLDKFLPPSVKPLAGDISFHTLETFPERGFGFLELPAAEAKKMKNRLNGSTLKGSKVKIEEARPEKKRKQEASDDDQEAEKKARKKAKKERRKREDGVLPGHELEEGRHVKRGWTEDGADAKAARKERRKREKTEQEDHGLDDKKMRFKTNLPPTATTAESKSSEKKDKKKKKKADKGKGGKTQTVVEEFSKNKKPAMNIAVESTAPRATVYEDGKGWVNDAGEVVESERPSKRQKRSRSDAAEGKDVVDTPTKQKSQSTPVKTASLLESVEKKSVHDSEASSSAEGDAYDAAQADKSDDSSSQAAADSDSESNSSAEQDAAKFDSEMAETSQRKEVHPLEALYKRPASSSGQDRQKPPPIETSFSFFTGAAEEDEDLAVNGAPQTPHTKRDLETRGNRSAAPTPETAAISRRFSLPFSRRAEGESDEESEDGDEPIEDAPQAAAGASKNDGEERGGESAFRKWFYEHRGDLNRGWKKRRRDERKQKRQRENRRLNRRIL